MSELKESASAFARVMGSASKLVLIMITGTLCAALFLGIVDQTLFEKALLLVLGYYFGKTQVSGPPSSQ